MEKIIEVLTEIGDDSLILGHRLGEWCGHGPVLEQDIALTNIALDLIGRARFCYQQLAILEQNDRDEDFYPYKRLERQFKNTLLVEFENVDFAYTIVRQFFFDTYYKLFFEKILKCENEILKAIAEKSLKETLYHLKYSSGWMLRLGDGTSTSNEKITKALNELWSYRNEFFINSYSIQFLIENKIIESSDEIQYYFNNQIKEIIQEAKINIPNETYNRKGGRSGIHSEKLGYILAEMQYLQRTYPNSTW
jgi:ring-1,2-phenylacetyl-CoA epoxidase subunit PaaC